MINLGEAYRELIESL